MTTILKSTMATYLFDDEVELEAMEQSETQESFYVLSLLRLLC